MKKTTPKQHEIIQDSEYPHMYRIVYPDGVVSEELYSKQWADEVIYRLENPQKGIDSET